MTLVLSILMIAQLSQSLIDELNMTQRKAIILLNMDLETLSQNLGICCGSMRMAVLEWQSKSI